MIDFEAFHFIRPLWLLAILPLAGIIYLLRRRQHFSTGWQQVLASHLYTHLINGDSQTRHKPPLWLLAMGWLLATIALAGPTWKQLPQPVYQLKTGSVIVLDMSMSMRATDVTPDRLTRAKYKAIDLVKALNEGDIGLVAYAGDAFTISPLSSDINNLITLLPSLSPEIMPIAGSEPFLGLLEATELLTNAGFQTGQIYWITDGVEQSQIGEIIKLMRETPFELSILSVGSEQGAPIKLSSGELMKDNRGAIVIPKLDTALLEDISNATGGSHRSLSADDSDIEYLISEASLQRELKESEEEQQDAMKGDKWQEVGPYLLLLLLPIAAYSFRRGLIAVVATALLLPVSSPPAHADWWQDLWKTEDQQAQEAFAADDYDEAAAKFNDPLWKGSAHYKSGNYAEAVESFSQFDSVQAHYNRGNALAKLGQLDEAIDAYEEVLSREPDHEDAAANKALLEQLKQQQEQQQNQQQSQDDQSQQSSEENSQQSEQQQSGEQNSESAENNQPSDSQPGEEGQQQQDEQSSEQQTEDAQQQSEQEQQSESQQPDKNTEGNEAENNEQQALQQAEPSELTEEQKEEMQRMQNLLRKIPDDPAFLLKRKMQLEYQQRRRERMPAQFQRNW